jgi:hypothetical protein
MQFAENVQANWQEMYCFIMIMPDPIQSEQHKREFKNNSGNFRNIFFTARTWPLVTFICLVRQKHFGGRPFADDEKVEMEVRTTVKNLLCGKFQRIGKVTGQVYQC